MIKCNNCGKEITSFMRISTGVIEDRWSYDEKSKSYIYDYLENADADCVERIVCNHCYKEVDDDIIDEIFDAMQ